MQYLSDGNSIKIGLLIIIVITGIPIISLTALITSSYLVGLFFYCFCVYCLIKYIGRLLMFPGSTAYVNGDTQIKLSNEFLVNSQHTFNHIQYLLERIIKKQGFASDSQLGNVIQKNIKNTIELFKQFQTTLSPRKIKLLKLYQQLFQQFRCFPHQAEDLSQTSSSSTHYSKHNLSLYNIANRPKKIFNLTQQENNFLAQKCLDTKQILLEICQIFRSFSPQPGVMNKYNYLLRGQKIFEIRFGFNTWKHYYQYDIHHIKTPDNNIIQSAIIYGEAGKNSKNSSQNRQTILFCNPNGVFIQFFAIDNLYIRNYVRAGYKVILWNYRGYGTSTGIPTIKVSQKDAKTVFDYYKHHNITITHGYSIGGSSAIGLASVEKSIKVLIADRTFSSIANISKGFGDTLHRLTKVIFYNDNVFLDEQYIECQTQYKLIIWDQSDEVIANSCSLKSGILDKIKLRKEKQVTLNNQKVKLSYNSLSTNIYKIQDQQKQLHHIEDTTNNVNNKKSQTHNDQNYFISIEHLKVFGNNVYNLFIQLYGRQDDHQTDSQNNHTQKLTDNIQPHSSDQTDYNYKAYHEENIRKVVDALKELDGGGLLLFTNRKLHYLISHSPIAKFNEYCNEYLLGLVYYGCCFPLDTDTMNQLQRKKLTIEKIEQALKDIQSIYQLNGQTMEKVFGNKAKFVEGLCKIFRYVLQVLAKGLQNEVFHLQTGMLLPTNNGHNCQLMKHEFDILMDIINRIKRQQQFNVLSVPQK